MRRLLWVVPVLVCAGLGLWWGTSRSSSDANGLIRKDPESRAPAGELAARLDALEAENKKVRRDLALTRLSAEKVAQKLESAASSQEAEQAEAPPENAGASLGDRQHAAMGILESELQARAASEVLDRAWTANAEGFFRQKLAALEGGPVFASARCGTSLCAVVVSHQDDAAHVGLVNAMQGHTHEFAGQFLVRRHPNPSGGYDTTFYFAKPGERIPDLHAALSGEY